MRFDVLTLFPEVFPGYLGQSLLKRAIDAGLVEVRLHNIRHWAQGKHRKVDDRPFGGGPGMVMMVEPVVECVEAVRGLARGPGTPGHAHARRGGGSTRPAVERLAAQRRILLLCGRYEGFDERIRLLLEPEEISIGDFVLNGGEVAAMVVIDAVIRLVPGVLGHEDSSQDDSFSGAERLLEFPQYTRPRDVSRLGGPRRSCSAATMRRSPAGATSFAASGRSSAGPTCCGPRMNKPCRAHATVHGPSASL